MTGTQTQDGREREGGVAESGLPACPEGRRPRAEGLRADPHRQTDPLLPSARYRSERDQGQGLMRRSPAAPGVGHSIWSQESQAGAPEEGEEKLFGPDQPEDPEEEAITQRLPPLSHLSS